MKENTVTASRTCQSLALALAQPVWQLLDILWILESNGQRNPTFLKMWLTAPCLFQNKRPTKNDTTPRERSNPETLDGPQSCIRSILGFWGILSCKEIQYCRRGIEHAKYFKIQSARGLVPLHCAKAISQSRFEYLAIYNSYSKYSYSILRSIWWGIGWSPWSFHTNSPRCKRRLQVEPLEL